MGKEFLTYNQQLKHLEQRGVAIPDPSAAVDALSRKSYYNIINGYRRLFLDQSSIVDNGPYKKGTTLDELDSLLVFDSNLRIVCLKRILGVELLVKSTIAYEFSGKYGTDDRKYLDPANFSAERPECRFVAKTLETIRDETESTTRQQFERMSLSGQIRMHPPMGTHERDQLWNHRILQLLHETRR